MPDRLTIRSIETTPLRVPLARTYRGSTYQMTHRSTIVTRVVTEEGVVGEAYAGDEDADLLAIERIIADEIAPSLLGEDAFAIERCWELARPVTFDILRNRRLGLVASACVDAALWDAVGKALGTPLWRLWGGYRSRIPMIAIAGYHDSPVSIADEVAELKELGLAGLKMKVGSASVEKDAERLRGRGPRAATASCSLPTRIRSGRARRLCASHGSSRTRELVWLEEPCRWDNDRRSLRDVRAGARVPVCAGQSEYSAAGCLDLMVGGSIDVCNFDSSWSGGPTEWRRAAAAAHTLGVAMAHHEEPQIACHLLASIPHGTYVECFHPDRDPIWWNLVANRPALVDGMIELPDRPGSAGSSISSTWRRTPLRDAQVLDAHAVDHRVVELDPEPGPVGHLQPSLAKLERDGRMPLTSGESATENSDHVGRSSVGDEVERGGDEHAGREAVRHDLDRRKSARASAICRATVKPPQRARSGCSTSTWPRSTRARNGATVLVGFTRSDADGGTF